MPKRKALLFCLVSFVVIMGFLFLSLFLEAIPTAFVFSLSYWVISAVGIYNYRGRERIDPLAPIVLSVCILFLYSYSSALGAAASNSTMYSNFVSEKTFRLYYVSCLLGVTALCLALIVRKDIQPAWRGLIPLRDCLGSSGITVKLLFLVFLFAVIGSKHMRDAFDFINVKSYAETALSSRLVRLESESLPFVDVFLMQVPIALANCLGIILLFRTRNVLLKSAGVAILLSRLLVAILSGGRSGVAIQGLLLVAFINYRIRRLSLKELGIVLVGGVLMLNTLALLRVTNKPEEMIRLYSETAQEGYGFLKLENSGEFSVGQNLMRLISGIDSGETGYMYGGGVVDGLLVFIPRALYPGRRPLPLSEQFIEVFYPGVRDSGAGYGFFYLMDGYWEYGLIGVFVFMFLYGSFLQLIYNWFRQNMTSDLMSLWYAFVLYDLVLASVRSGLVSSMKAAAIDSLPFLVLYVFSNFAGGGFGSYRAVKHDRIPVA